MNRRFALHVGGLLTIALALRLYALGDNPAGFFRDEADKGYTTYSLLQTGCDQTGAFLPLFVRSLNVTTSAVYQYLDLPFVAAMGLSETAVRLPAALAGSLSVLAALLVGRAWWGPAAGLWAGWFVCLSPWSLLLSRWANQSILLTVFVPLGFFFFTKAKAADLPSRRQAVCSALAFLVALYSYEPARLVVPLLVALLPMVYLDPTRMRRFGPARVAVIWGIFWGIFAVGALPMLYHMVAQPEESSARFSSITIFRGQPLIVLFREWAANYGLHLSPGFLFVHGDQNLRHHTAVFGQLHWPLAPLLVLGLFRAIRCHGPIDRVLLVWFFTFPVAAACTWESIPHALRSIFAVPVAHLLAVNGILEFRALRERFYALIEPRLWAFLIRTWLAAMVFFPALFLYDLFVRYPVYSAFAWEYGYRDAVGWWRDHRARADRTVVSGIAEYPYVFFLFYGEVPPEEWIATHAIKDVDFISTGQAADAYYHRDGERDLYLLRLDELPFFQPEKVIRLPSGEPVWKWVTNFPLHSPG